MGLNQKIEPINEFVDNIINQKWQDTDTPNTESKKSLEKQLSNITKQIEEATDTVKLGKQIDLIKKLRKDAESSLKSGNEEDSKKLLAEALKILG